MVIKIDQTYRHDITLNDDFSIMITLSLENFVKGVHTLSQSLIFYQDLIIVLIQVHSFSDQRKTRTNPAVYLDNFIVIRYLCTYRGTQEPVKIHT